MIASFRRSFNIYAAFAAMVPKEFLAYNVWVIMEFIAQILSMTIFAFFWRAAYSETNTLSGLSLQQTINYILLAQVLMPIVETRVIFSFGFLQREGRIAVELLRPVDFQLRNYVENLAHLGIFVVQQLPLFLIAWLVFGLEFPADALTWLAFAVTLLLGQSILFFFDWLFACLSFYSTETWGLSVVRIGVATFFSGALVPLTMMPGWLQALAAALPFAQTVFVPVAFLSGITPLASLPQVLLTQIGWLVALVVISRAAFRVAVRKVTVQGG